MIYHLFDYLQRSGVDFPGVGLLNYLTVRAMLASVTAILVALIFGKKFIAFLQRKQVHDEERSYDKGLAGQELKNRTPSMGGVIIIVSILAALLRPYQYIFIADAPRAPVVRRTRIRR